ncbi:hypothetical protein KDX31_15870 [Amphritea atlantica]|uniref:Uncharacterized protein n=1 Tax=Amphritea atlantica TaxID=355243 RepID=A0ABY5GS76_9GAMM|nr:hypothetical protein KDX31_15870 [Amphritea atlantica]
MSDVVYIDCFPVRSIVHNIQKKNENSWWVIRRTLGIDGTPLPYGRVVYFSRTFTDAETWISHQKFSYYSINNLKFSVDA